jgi:hypothetical protein
MNLANRILMGLITVLISIAAAPTVGADEIYRGHGEMTGEDTSNSAILQIDGR